MRIDPSLVVVAPVASETSAKPRTKRTTKPPASVVSLSSAGAAVVADGDDGEEAMSPRVQTLRMMVEKGDYKVDLDTLASRIVDDEVVRARR